jgi:hypothetical protein
LAAAAWLMLQLPCKATPPSNQWTPRKAKFKTWKATFKLKAHVPHLTTTDSGLYRIEEIQAVEQLQYVITCSRIGDDVLNKKHLLSKSLDGDKQVVGVELIDFNQPGLFDP